jgi:prevent-host-death family protein
VSRAAKPKSSVRVSSSRATHVGTAELRGNLAKYLRQAKAGTPIIIKERGRSAYVLLRFEDAAEPAAFGCMRARTEYAAGAVVNASEAWRAGVMP